MAGILLLPEFPSGLNSFLWRTAVTDDCDILVYWYGRKYFISQHCYLLFILKTCLWLLSLILFIDVIYLKHLLILWLNSEFSFVLCVFYFNYYNLLIIGLIFNFLCFPCLSLLACFLDLKLRTILCFNWHNLTKHVLMTILRSLIIMALFRHFKVSGSYGFPTTETVGYCFGGSKELQYHSPLCLSTEKISSRGKVIRTDSLE